MTKKYWYGDVPTRCDILVSRKINDRFVDGKTIYGPWACMHPDSHKIYGVGLGMGRGQLYEKQSDGKWLKIDG
jgi:hypothetical protein